MQVMKRQQKCFVVLLGMVIPAFLSSCGSTEQTAKPGPKSEPSTKQNTANKPEPINSAAKIDPKMPAILKDESKLENWLPDQNVLSEHAKGIAKPGDATIPFEVHFPNGMNVFTNKNYAALTYEFIAKERENLSRASMIISFVPKLKGQKEQDSIWACQESAMEGTRSSGRKQDWKLGPLEAGKIDGITFLRQKWQGSIKLQTRIQKLKGFFYTGRLGDTLIFMASQDEEPHCDETLKQTENSLLSFKLLKTNPSSVQKKTDR